MWLEYSLGKDAFIATNFVLDHRVFGLKVSSLRFAASESRVFKVSGLRVLSLRSWFLHSMHYQEKNYYHQFYFNEFHNFVKNETLTQVFSFEFYGNF